MLFLFIHCALRLEQPDILFYFPLFDKLLRCYGQCLGREQQGYVLHYWRKFSEFILFLIKWVVAVLSAMLRKGIALAVCAVDYVNEGLQKIDGVIIISYSKKNALLM